jgi:hypothetical protein
VVLALAIIPSNAVAQSTSFGSQVKIGDSDFVPQLVSANRIDFLHLALGTTNNIQDDGFYLAIRGAAATASAPTSVQTYNLRLTAVGGKAAGTLVEDADTAEKGVTAGFHRLTWGAGSFGTPHNNMTHVANLTYADVNNDGRYNEGDWVYLVYGGACLNATLGTCNLRAPALSGDNVTSVTIRLTDVSATLKAGTVVFASDSDFTSWNTATKRLPSGSLRSLSHHGAVASVGFFNADLSGGTASTTATITPGDAIYITPTNITGTTSTPPLYSIRLSGSFGAFGSQVKVGDTDFVPTMTVGNLVCVKQLALGTTNNIQDDGFYLSWRPAGVGLPTSVQTYDLRLTAVAGKAAGTLVEDADTAEKGVTAGFSRSSCTVAGTSAATGNVKIVYADVNNDGRYNQGDWVYLVKGHTAAQCAFTAGAVCQLLAPTLTSDNATTYAIRLTDVSSTLKAGSVVFASDSDFTSWSSSTKALPATYLSSTSALLFNADLSGGAAPTVTPGDSIYLQPSNSTGNGTTPALYSVRLLGSGGAFGSQVRIGDSDFVPGLTPLTQVRVMHLALGTTNNIQDDGVYLGIRNGGAFPTAVNTYDLRLTKVGSKNAGTLVEDADTAEKGVTAGWHMYALQNQKLAYADVNNDGRYNLGDWVYLVIGQGVTCTFASVCPLVAPTIASDNATAFTVRLTDVSATLKAGSIVFASDSDFTSWNTATKALASYLLSAASTPIFNADLSGGTTATTATLTPGDTVYVTPTNTSAGATPPLYSIRAHGDAPPGRGVTTSSSPPPTSDTTDETSDTSSPVTTTSSPPTTTSSPAPTTTKKTPGLGLAGLIGALGAGMAIVVALRRKD